QRELAPIGQTLGVFGEARLGVDDALAYGLQTLAAQLLVQPLGEHESCLPIIEAVEHDEDAPAADAAEGAACHLRVLWNARQSKPQYIRGRRRLDWRTSRQLPHLGESSVGANGQCRPRLVPAVRPNVAHP